MKKTALSIIATLALSAPAIACEGQGKACPVDSKSCPMPGHGGHGGYGKHHQHMQEMDTDNDGKVSFKEFKKAHSDSALKDRFKTMDANGDGFISADDRQARHKSRMDERFTGMDSNKDGVISKEEFEAAAPQHHGPGKKPMKGSW